MSNENGGTEIDLTDVGGISRTLSADVDEIEDQTSQTFNLYDRIRTRAQRGVPDEVSWSFSAGEVSLDEVGVQDTTVSISSKVEQELHGVESPETVSFDSENVGEYVSDIVTRIDEVRNVKGELESRIESAERLSQQAFSEFVDSTELLDTYDDPSSALEGSWGEKLQQHMTAKEGRAETRKAVEEMTTSLASEETALQNELANVVNAYVSEAYDQAVNISEELGGAARPYEGEVDLLAKIADSRGQIIQNRGDPEDYEFVSPEMAAQTALMDVSKDAMESQAQLVAQLSSELGTAMDEVYGMIDTVDPENRESYVDRDSVESAYSSLEAMKEGFSEMSNIADEECYDTFAEAIREVMSRGMAEDEEFDDQYSFAMDDIPHIGSSEEAGGRM